MINDRLIQQISDFHRSNGASEERIKNIANYAQMNVRLETEEDSKLKLLSTKLKFTQIGKDEVCIMHKSNSLETNLKAIINLLLACGTFTYDESNITP